MKRIFLALILLLPMGAFAQEKEKPYTLKAFLLEQLHTAHDKADWFVPANVAVEGLTAEQANWKDSSGKNHSVGQLAYHLLFWNQQVLAKFKGETPEKFSGNNDETFDKFDAAKWDATVKALDKVMKDIEQVVETADEKKLEGMASTIAHIGQHNAYHVGQIIFVRKLQGSWNPEKGVK